MRLDKSEHGFTIVELLIVIVVIAILAAISVVAFTGIQTRAENTTTTNAVAAYAKALRATVAETGVYPGPTGGAWRCLPTDNEYCGSSSNSPSCFGLNRTPPYNDIYTYVESVASNLPKISSQQIPCGDGRVVTGAFYRLEPGNKIAYIAYFLKGDVPCSEIGGMPTSRQVLGDATRCNLRLPDIL